MTTFTHTIKQKHLPEGINIIIEGKKNNIKHTFNTTLTYKELKKQNYNEVVKGLVDGLEQKINILTIQNI